MTNNGEALSSKLYTIARTLNEVLEIITSKRSIYSKRQIDEIINTLMDVSRIINNKLGKFHLI